MTVDPTVVSSSRTKSFSAGYPIFVTCSLGSHTCPERTQVLPAWVPRLFWGQNLGVPSEATPGSSWETILSAGDRTWVRFVQTKCLPAGSRDGIILTHLFDNTVAWPGHGIVSWPMKSERDTAGHPFKVFLTLADNPMSVMEGNLERSSFHRMVLIQKQPP